MPMSSDKMPIEKVPGYQSEVSRRRLEYVEQNWYNIEENWSIEEQKKNRADFDKKLQADLEAEYKSGQCKNWNK